jgi:uncharacterized membrane protein YoaK (UPF0700 family)
MVKMIFAFISLFVIFFFGIDIFRNLTGREKINLTKWIGYSTLCSLLAIGAVTIIVLLF